MDTVKLRRKTQAVLGSERDGRPERGAVSVHPVSLIFQLNPFHSMKLNHEAYYADVHKLNFHGGKRWIAPEQLIKEDVRQQNHDSYIYL